MKAQATENLCFDHRGQKLDAGILFNVAQTDGISTSQAVVIARGNNVKIIQPYCPVVDPPPTPEVREDKHRRI